MTEEIQKFEDFIASVSWTFAKTFAKTSPHDYIVKDKLAASDRKLFEEFVLFIRANGTPKKYKKSVYVHLDIDGFSYWTMGAPLDITTIINRHKLSFYDLVSDKYDQIFSDEKSQKENAEVFGMFEKHLAGEVFDLGCGTGLLLDLMPGLSDCYTGVDPSGKMVEQLQLKHPSALAVVATFEDFTPVRKFDFIASLFGSISYVNPQYFSKLKYLLAENGKYFLMFFKENYFPVTYQRTGVCFSHYKTDSEQLKDIFTHTFEYSNYVVATNILQEK